MVVRAWVTNREGSLNNGELGRRVGPRLTLSGQRYKFGRESTNGNIKLGSGSFAC